MLVDQLTFDILVCCNECEKKPLLDVVVSVYKIVYFPSWMWYCSVKGSICL